MQTRFYDDPLDSLRATPSVFLAGPTARGIRRTPWRAEALTLFERAGYRGTVMLPEFRDDLFDDAAPRVFGHGSSPVPGMKVRSFNVLAWETTGIESASTVLFWMPFHIADIDDPASLPGFTTRAEVSREIQRAPERLVLGMPPGALSGGHIRYHAHHRGVRVWDTLAETVAAVLVRKD